MITEKDLREAIAECEGERNPNANTCIKLAAFYTIKNNMYPDGVEARQTQPVYSYAEPPRIGYDSDSEFGRLIDGMDWDTVLPVFDELMDTLHVMVPKLYDGVMRKLREA